IPAMHTIAGSAACPSCQGNLKVVGPLVSRGRVGKSGLLNRPVPMHQCIGILLIPLQHDIIAMCLRFCRLIDDRAWPSGKAVDFGSTIPSSNLGARAIFCEMIWACYRSLAPQSV